MIESRRIIRRSRRGGQERLLLAVVAIVAPVALLFLASLLVLRRGGRRAAPSAVEAALPGAVPGLPSATLATDPAPGSVPPSERPPDVEGGPARGDSPADP